ncbi:hypothetical protein OCT51_12115 [Halomonas sp. LR3S48]|uniref:hypothetical protein n=1 Tax=Halomonas sp. LR3S48 TaxID=2982694 RepID=UPI0021E46C2A|nr:hypothetical protein [Halomonas sp. LR3S48]UYG01950.1 hypothetical protein OCT51_12115 [Halomonas sp. LR3S48]
MSTIPNSLRIALYGDVNANIMDGSAIWLRNIAKLCAAVPNAEVDLFLKAVIERGQIIDELSEISNLVIHEPGEEELSDQKTLTQKAAINKIEKEDRKKKYKAVILRGAELCLCASQSSVLIGRVWSYLTDIPQSYINVSQENLASLNEITRASRYVLCQTEEMRNFLSNIISEGHHKLVLLPPMVPDEAFAETQCNRDFKIFYSGKFAPAWAVETLVDITRSVDIPVVVAGDKFHRVPEDKKFKPRLEEKLTKYHNIKWLGAISPIQVFEQLRTARLGYAWRQPIMNSSLELSTKLLEYGAAGLAVITNPTPAHQALLGSNYPFFASNEEELKVLVKSLPERFDEITAAGKLCRKIAERFSFSSLQNDFNVLFKKVNRKPLTTTRESPLKVVLAGHDLKFARELIEYLESRSDVVLEVDLWKSLRENNPSQSKKLAEWADIVFCEWCAGNAVWYSENIDPNKTKLFIRFHRIEILMEFAPKVRMDAVHSVFFVGPHLLRQAKEKFDWEENKLHLLPNFVDVELYDREKFRGSEFNIGLIGFVPKLKRLDRALDILSELRKHDKRYTLFVKGRFPWEYPWIWRKPEEREFYEACFKRIKEEESLRDAVVFDPFGSDVAAWLRKIGIILSVSDLESFHMALAEGIASGAYPLLWDREGATEIFPWLPCSDSAKELANNILKERKSGDMFFKEKLKESYDVNKTMKVLDKFIT